jgi:transmembrane sensor
MRTRDERLHALIVEQAAEWYVANRDGVLAPPQRQDFMRWLRASPVHVAEYLAIAGVERDVGDAARRDATPLPQLLREAGVPDRVAPFEGDGAASALSALSPREHRAGARHGVRTSRAPERPFMRWGAAFAVLVSAGVVIFGGFQWFASRPQVQDYATRHGEQRSLQLPDNTVVWLDSDSAVAVRFDRRQRSVEVTRGQAYFQVAKDARRPFGVRVDGLWVKDIGTAFDVYRQGDGATITVAEGQVQVWHASPATSTGWFGLDRHPSAPQGRPIVNLTAGRQARIAASGRVEAQGAVDVRQVTAWTQGNIVFENQPIAEVASQFNRYNNLQISVGDPRIGALPVSGTFDAHDVATFVTFLDSLPGVKVETRDGRVRVIAAVAALKHRK